ncbi:MAG: hypothetical protein ABR564_09085 [Candidatus Dormibacteria bacterium]
MSGDASSGPRPRITVRWSEHEARKSYARPFGVTFQDQTGVGLGSIAVSGADLLYYRQFQAASLTLAGELFRDPRVEASGDPQRAWLDVLAGILPAAVDLEVLPRSEFDQAAGRLFRFTLSRAGEPLGTVDAALVLSYQDFQAAVAHGAGALYRNASVEAVADPVARQAAWSSQLTGLLQRPSPADAMAESWPWR